MYDFNPKLGFVSVFFPPPGCFLLIRFYSIAMRIQIGQIHLSSGIALQGGQVEPFACQPIVLRNGFTLIIFLVDKASVDEATEMK